MQAFALYLVYITHYTKIKYLRDFDQFPAVLLLDVKEDSKSNKPDHKISNSIQNFYLLSSFGALSKIDCFSSQPQCCLHLKAQTFRKYQKHFLLFQHLKLIGFSLKK